MDVPTPDSATDAVVAAAMRAAGEAFEASPCTSGHIIIFAFGHPVPEGENDSSFIAGGWERNGEAPDLNHEQVVELLMSHVQRTVEALGSERVRITFMPRLEPRGEG